MANMFAGPIRPDKAPKLKLRGTTSYLFALLALGFACLPSSAGPTANVCGDIASLDFLRCVGELIDAAKAAGQDRLSGRLRDVLIHMAETEGYGGSESNIEKIKAWSKELKDHDPVSNGETIAALDNAIASYKDELRPAVSTLAAAREALDAGTDRANADKLAPGPDTNIHPLFVRRKLAFLGAKKAEFYDHGPFEIVRRLLLANSIEESYFLDKAAGIADFGKLRRELQIVGDLQNLYEKPPSYLTIRQERLQKNSNLFWRASILFALGDKGEFVQAARMLAINNRNWGFDGDNAGHVYSYRVFNRPYAILLLGRDNRGEPMIEIKDPGLLNRFYNPAQLALVICAQLDGAGSDQGIDSYTKAVRELTFHDLYVVAASARRAGSLRKFENDVTKTFNDRKFKQESEALVSRVNNDAKEFSDMISRGAKQCGITDEVRDEIHQRFTLKPRIEQRADSPKNERLVFGGRLDANAASAVADLIKNVFETPEIRSVAEELGVSTSVFATRMPIDN
jgi:hypothetical protein